MEDRKKEPHRFPQKYNPQNILLVLLKTREKKTSVIKSDLVEIIPEYETASLKWFTRGSMKLESEGLVKRIKKQKDIAYYWVITPEGELIKKQLEKKEQEK